MNFCLGLAAFISFTSIFAFFGKAFSNTGGTVVPNMFQLMFGGHTDYQGYVIAWKQYGWLTFLFVLQIFIMIGSLVTAFSINKDDDNAKSSCGAICGLMSLAALIISFCTLAITEVGSAADLGFGPIFYSILHIIAMILYFASVVISSQTNEQAKTRVNSSASLLYSAPSPTKRLYTEKEKEELINANKNMLQKGIITQEEFDKRVAEIESRSEKPKPAKPQQPNLNMSEAEKADLIIKYKKMLDDGIITQEEFDLKKKDLLK